MVHYYFNQKTLLDPLKQLHTYCILAQSLGKGLPVQGKPTNNTKQHLMIIISYCVTIHKQVS